MLFAHSKESGDFIPATKTQIGQHGVQFVKLLLCYGLFSSWITSYDHLLVAGTAISSDWFAFSQLFSLSQWINNLLHAILLQGYLQTYCEGFLFIISLLSGKQVLPVMLNPILESTSPR